MFEPEALNLAVRKALEASPIVPEGARGAFVTIASREGIQAAIAMKIADQWELQAIVNVQSNTGWKLSKVNFAVAVTGTF